ncbi:MAG: hypothetical protein IPM96_18785 [Ignavibacteria bacterium]|nr:hypothetical protein [Ignavibacteria bacterium]
MNISSTPELITPANNSINNPNTINFKWNKINSAIYYILDISNDLNFNNIFVSDTILIDTSKIVKGFQDDSKYYWRVRAKDSLGGMLSSVVWNFTTILPIYLDINILFEGMYYPLFNLMSRRDTVTAYLYQITSPYNKVDSARSVIDSISFKGLFKFHNAKSGIYFIAVKHFNTIETWSKKEEKVF